MEQKPRSFVLLTLFVCLILAGLTVPGYSQEKPAATQTPAKKGKVAKPPARYPTALAGLEVLADLSVSPTSYKGSCPAVFTFKGKITVNRATIVQYRFVRSDNTRHALGVLTFDGPGSQEVTDTWVFDDPAQLPAFQGWEAIQTNLPMKIQSNIALFSGTCTDYKGGPPTPQSPASKDSSWPQPDPQLPPVKR